MNRQRRGRYRPRPRNALPICLGLILVANVEATAESLNTACRVEDALLASEERVALRAHVHLHSRLCAADGERRATRSTRHCGLNVLGMNSSLHGTPAALAPHAACGTCLSNSGRIWRHAQPTFYHAPRPTSSVTQLSQASVAPSAVFSTSLHILPVRARATRLQPTNGRDMRCHEQRVLGACSLHHASPRRQHCRGVRPGHHPFGMVDLNLMME